MQLEEPNSEVGSRRRASLLYPAFLVIFINEYSMSQKKKIKKSSAENISPLSGEE